jgi:hypothetical protein
MPHTDIIATFNHFASIDGQNPVKRFATRADGAKPLTALADALRAKGITEASAPVEFPVMAKAAEEDATSPKAKAAPKATDVPAHQPAKANAVRQ